MENCVFVYAKKENLSNDKRIKAIVVWPGDDLDPPPRILPLGGSLERDEEIRKRLEEVFRG